MSSKKPSQTEEDYFAREDIEKRYKLAREVAARQQVAEAQALRDAHFMHCPKCGHALQTIQLREVAVDRCFHCHGTWLDEGELEKLAAPEASHSLLQSVVDIFRSRG